MVGFDSKRSVNKNWRIPWLSDLDTKTGLRLSRGGWHYFQKWFRRSFVRWKELNAWSSGRIAAAVLICISTIGVPGCFHAEGEETEAVDCISKKLGEAWPGHSTFFISIETSASKDAGIVYKFLSSIGLGRHPASMAFRTVFRVLLQHDIGGIAMGVLSADRGPTWCLLDSGGRWNAFSQALEQH